MANRPKPAKASLSDRMVTQLVKVFGPAQVSRMGAPRSPSADPLGGLGSEWEMRRGSDGRTFLVRADPAGPTPGDAGAADGARGAGADGAPRHAGEAPS